MSETLFNTTGEWLEAAAAFRKQGKVTEVADVPKFRLLGFSVDGEGVFCLPIDLAMSTTLQTCSKEVADAVVTHEGRADLMKGCTMSRSECLMGGSSSLRRFLDLAGEYRRKGWTIRRSDIKGLSLGFSALKFKKGAVLEHHAWEVLLADVKGQARRVCSPKEIELLQTGQGRDRLLGVSQDKDPPVQEFVSHNDFAFNEHMRGIFSEIGRKFAEESEEG